MNVLSAGSGSIMESLRLHKKLVVVVNEDLMDNHQIELAQALSERQYLCYGMTRYVFFFFFNPALTVSLERS